MSEKLTVLVNGEESEILSEEEMGVVGAPMSMPRWTGFFPAVDFR